MRFFFYLLRTVSSTCSWTEQHAGMLSESTNQLNFYQLLFDFKIIMIIQQDLLVY